jgi:hypothetical protein
MSSPDTRSGSSAFSRAGRFPGRGLLGPRRSRARIPLLDLVASLAGALLGLDRDVLLGRQAPAELEVN